MDADQSESKRSKASLNGRASSPVFSDSDNDSLPEIECRVCNKSFLTVRSYEQHVNSKKHYNQLTKQKMVSKQKQFGNLEQSDSDEDDKLNSEFTELSCADCAMKFSGYKSFVAHIHGSVHAKNLKKRALKEELKDRPELINGEDSEDDLIPKPIAKCTLCEKEFSGLESFKQHLTSALHKKKLKQQKIMESVKAEQEGTDGEVADDFFKKCRICDKSFSGVQSYNIHMKSSIHHKALKRIEMEKTIEDLCTKDATNTKFVCKECHKPFTDPFAFKSHLDNNSHEKYEAKKTILDLVSANPDIVAGKTVQSVPSELDDKDDYRVGDYILLCKLCHMSFSGPESAVSHVNSKKHLKVKEEKERVKLLLEAQNKKKAMSESRPSDERAMNGKSGDALNSLVGARSEKKLKNTTNGAEENDDFELI